MSFVVDASVVVAALLDSGPDGRWAETKLVEEQLVAPHILPAEVANIMRRAVLTREISEDAASLAFVDLIALRIELFPFEPLAPRIWELRGSVTAYDAWYVALAEDLGAPLVTLDRKLSRAPGPRCEFLLPSSDR